MKSALPEATGQAALTLHNPSSPGIRLVDGRMSLHDPDESESFRESPSLSYLYDLGSDASRSAVTSHLNWIVVQIMLLAGADAEQRIKNLNEEQYRSLHMHFDWSSLRRKHAQYLLERRQVKVERDALTGVQRETPTSKATCDAMLNAVRSVCKMAVVLGQMSHEHYLQVCSVKAKGSSRKKPMNPLNEAGIQKLLRSTKQDLTAIGLRDTAMLATMLGCGLRRGEVGEIQVENYSVETGHIKLIGKGNKEAVLKLPPWAKPLMDEWVVQLRDQEIPGALFCRIARSETLIRDKGLSGGGIQQILEKRLLKAGMSTDTKPHDLRRTLANRLDNRGVSLDQIQASMRHANPATTLIYLEQSRLQRKIDDVANQDDLAI